MLKRRAVLFGAAALLCLGLAALRWMPRHAPAPSLPAAKPAASDTAPRIPALPPSSAEASGTSPDAIPTTLLPENPGRTAAEWQALLTALAPEGYEARHPGMIARLADLMLLHPGDVSWEAGTAAYLIEEIPVTELGKRLPLWQKAADLLPSNPAVSDALVRLALEKLPPEEIDALLKAQAGCFPEDPHLLWLRASLAFKGSHPEDALTLLKQASSLPPWEDWTGVSRMSSLDVREALGGPHSSLQVLMTSVGIVVPDLSKLKEAANAATAWAKDLQTQGDPGKAREVLEQAVAMGRRFGETRRSTFNHVFGNAIEKKALQNLQALCLATGDAPGAETAARRLEEIQAEKVAFCRWNDIRWAGFETSVAFRTYGSMEGSPEEDRIQAAENLLTPEEKALCEEYRHGDMPAFRAWQKSQQPPAAPSGP